nr:zinc ribbon domain-containing protein [uncultured Blautia sp.]
MKKVGIVLIVLQVFAALGGIASGNAPFLNIGGAADIFKLLGYFAPGIIGVILTVKAGKKEKTGKEEPVRPVSAAPSGTVPSGKAGFCPKCGKSSDPEDVYCIHCGAHLKRK